MLGRFEHGGRTHTVDFDRGQSLAIPLNPHGDQPSFFTREKATAEPLRIGDYVGSMDAGGSCNAEVIRYVPHCQGTHTECVGHVTQSGHTVQNTIDNRPGLCRVITVHGSLSSETTEDYPVQLDNEERLISSDEITGQLGPYTASDYTALVIRTVPNSADKMVRDYAKEPHYPVLSRQALQMLADSTLLHLLIDMPSLDKADDGGHLVNHHSWWGLDENPGLGTNLASKRSVTEMIYVPQTIEDGEYWLQIQLSPVVSDACASRPIIYPLVES